MAAKICVVGSSNTDMISYVERLPVWGETLIGQRFEMGFGGKGANQCIAAAKLGAPCAMVTKVGTDVLGRDTVANYEKMGVDTKFVLTTDQASTGVAPIAVDPSGSNCIIVVPGANDLLTEADVEAARAVIEGAKVLLVQLEVPVATTLAALRIARAAGVPTVVNPAPSPPGGQLPKEMYELADYFCPNEPECGGLTGAPVETDEDCVKAARILIERGCKNVVMTMGSRGALLIGEAASAEGGHQLVAAQKVDKVVDTSGAGDSFLGSFAFFLVMVGCSPPEAIRRACVVAGVSVQGEGTQKSYPRRENLDVSLFEL